MSEAAAVSDAGSSDPLVARRRERLRQDAGYRARIALIRRQIETDTLPPPIPVERLMALRSRFEHLK